MDFFTTILILLYLSPAFATSHKSIEAKISGDTYLGETGKKAVVNLKNEQCEIQSIGADGADGQPPKSFKIIFSCGASKQVLWDISKPSADDFNFDDPKFSLLWAGDQDGDGKIDVKMDMSPKYSCTKEVLYLSTKAETGNLVGVSGMPKTTCGE